MKNCEFYRNILAYPLPNPRSSASSNDILQRPPGSHNIVKYVSKNTSPEVLELQPVQFRPGLLLHPEKTERRAPNANPANGH